MAVRTKSIITETEGHWGYIKGTAKWAKVLELDQFGKYSIDIYGDDVKKHTEDIFSKLQADGAKEVEKAGKKYTLADLTKTNEETGEEYIQFKLPAENYEGKPNKIKIYDASGTLIEDWEKLIGNGSIVKLKYLAKPYYMNTTKMVGVSYKFYAVQVIKLSEYTNTDEGFGDETGGGSISEEEDF